MRNALQDAWLHWGLFGDGSDIVMSLEDEGYRWMYTGDRVTTNADLGVPFALIVNEFPQGTVVAAKDIPSVPVLERYSLVPLDYATEKQTMVERILQEFSGDSIELFENRYKWAVLIHPATRQGVAWQASKFDDLGPWGHHEGDTKRAVVEQLVEIGNFEVLPGAVALVFS